MQRKGYVSSPFDLQIDLLVYNIEKEPHLVLEQQVMK